MNAQVIIAITACLLTFSIFALIVALHIHINFRETPKTTTAAFFVAALALIAYLIVCSIMLPDMTMCVQQTLIFLTSIFGIALPIVCFFLPTQHMVISILSLMISLPISLIGLALSLVGLIDTYFYFIYFAVPFIIAMPWFAIEIKALDKTEKQTDSTKMKHKYRARD